MRRIAMTAGAALSAAVLIVPGVALAKAQTLRCPNVTFSYQTNFYQELGVRVTDIGCAPASRILKRAVETNHDPAGWTISDTGSTFNSTTDTAVCGFAYKRGPQRIAWHTVNPGGGC